MLHCLLAICFTRIAVELILALEDLSLEKLLQTQRQLSNRKEINLPERFMLFIIEG